MNVTDVVFVWVSFILHCLLLHLPMQRGQLWFSKGLFSHIALNCSLLPFSLNKGCCEQACPRITCVYQIPLHSQRALCVFLIGECRCVGFSSILLISAYTLDDKVSETQHLCSISAIKDKEGYGNLCKHLHCHLSTQILVSIFDICFLYIWKQKDCSAASVNRQPQ